MGWTIWYLLLGVAVAAVAEVSREAAEEPNDLRRGTLSSLSLVAMFLGFTASGAMATRAVSASARTLLAFASPPAAIVARPRYSCRHLSLHLGMRSNMSTTGLLKMEL